MNRSTRKIASTTVIAVLAATALAASAAAQVEIDRRRPAAAKGEVSIDNDFGSVVVHGWDKGEVVVIGTVAAGSDGFDFDSDKEGTSISVSVPDAWFQAPGEDPAFRTTLDVYVPAGSSLSISTTNASVAVDAVNGQVEVRTVNGAVRLAGARSAVEIETMTGAIDVQALGVPMELNSISGAVTVEGARGELDIETVSGKVSAAGEAVSSVRIQTTTGPVEFRGSLAAQGGIEIETFSSPVRLKLPKNVKSVFDLQTFGGKIQSQFCSGTPVTRERFEPFRQLHCSTGPEEFEIRIRTHDADIVLEAQQ